MAQAIIAAKHPMGVELEEAQEYYWCSCGRSKSQPFCDGSHRGTDLTPLAFKAESSGKAFLCMCKHTKTPPYCDGSHQLLAKEAAMPIADADSASVQATPEEPTVKRIHDLAKFGLEQTGHHGEMVAMGVPRTTLPQWDDIQILAAQFATKPLMEDVAVGSELVIGANAKKPLVLVCSGEGGMLREEQAANSRYFYELASAKFGFEESLLRDVQAFHFKGGQGAKTGTGGHLPGAKVTEKIAEVRGLKVGEDAVSPPTFVDLHTPTDFKRFADRVREISGGIPIGMKLSANHIEDDIDFALASSVDYIILDGRGGGTGAAPRIFRDHISVPTIPALARARRHLDQLGRGDITLIVTGGLRMPEDFIKAMALGADGIALANSALQSIGCVAARMCNTNQCPAGIATQKPELRAKLDVEASAQRLARFFGASTELMKVMARACGHNHLNQFNAHDITTWKKEMADLSGISFGGVR